LAEQIVNVFEHGETDSNYDACEELMDQRGYTCGKVGFTTGTNDALLVIERYSKARKNNLLNKYLPELRRISKLPWDGSGDRGDTSRLRGYPEAWKAACCTDNRFLKAQDEVEEELYLTPALKLAHWHKITSELGKAIFF
ncbi:glycoside hydrolase, partial [Basidiobolus meristosporus CBS 931.73]